jgi:hypothetical protein
LIEKRNKENLLLSGQKRFCLSTVAFLLVGRQGGAEGSGLNNSKAFALLDEESPIIDFYPKNVRASEPSHGEYDVRAGTKTWRATDGTHAQTASSRRSSAGSCEFQCFGTSYLFFTGSLQLYF